MAVFTGQEGEPKRKKCMVCGQQKAHAYWMGRKVIQVCYECAIDPLVSLIVDALWVSYKKDPGRLFERIETRFWQALWCNERRDNEGKRK
jgi:hypothetical protein